MDKFEKLKQVLNLKSDPVGVKLIYSHDKNIKNDANITEATSFESYCEYVKRASEGEFLKIKKRHLSCKTAQIMLGFQDSDNLELTMRLNIKGLKHILLFPVNRKDLEDFDSIILILNPRNCMNIIRAYVRLYHKPLKITCGAINGVCSEVTAYVIKRNEVNFSFLCPNSRENGTFDDCDLLCGIPAKLADEMLNEIIKVAKSLKMKIHLS